QVPGGLVAVDARDGDEFLQQLLGPLDADAGRSGLLLGCHLRGVPFGGLCQRSFGCSVRDMPPSTGIAAPVTQRAAGEARKATTSATSAPAATPRSGVCATKASSTPGRCSCASISGVRTRPGRTALQRTPAGPS